MAIQHSVQHTLTNTLFVKHSQYLSVISFRFILLWKLQYVEVTAFALGANDIYSILCFSFLSLYFPSQCYATQCVNT
jgi:hypothetical protein